MPTKNIKDIDEVQSAKLDALTKEMQQQKSSAFDPTKANEGKADNDEEFSLPVTEEFDLDNNLLLDEKLDQGGLDDDEMLI